MAAYTGADKAVGYLFTASNNTAEEYSSAATYAAGAFVIHEGTLYKCTSAIGTPEDWTPAHWTQTTIMENAGGGGGGGTTVIANPTGAATDTLNKLQVGATIYDVPSGGGSSGHIWSTTEHIIGTWIDGSTVYEKTVDFGENKLINSNTWYTTSIPSTGIGAIINAYGMNAGGTFFGFLGVSRDGGPYLQILQTRNAAITLRWFTYQYLKPIDTTVYTRVLENGTDTRTTENGTDTRTTENIAGV